MRLELESTSPATSDNVLARDSDLNSVAVEAKELLAEGIKAAQSGDRGKARVSLLKSAELDPLSESAWLWLASISEYPEELLVFLTNVLNINPENQRAVEWTTATKSLLSKTFVQRGIDAFEENKHDYAAQCFNQALEYDQNNPMAWLWLASLSDSDEGKIAYFEKVLSIDSQNDTAKSGYDSARYSISQRQLAEARAAAVAGKSFEANEFLDAILAENPDSEDAWMLRAHLADGFDRKIVAFENVLQLNPENIAARSGLDSLLAIVETVAPPQHTTEHVIILDDISEPESERSHEEMSVAAEAADESAVENVGVTADDQSTEFRTEADFETANSTGFAEANEFPELCLNDIGNPMTDDVEARNSAFAETAAEWSPVTAEFDANAAPEFVSFEHNDEFENLESESFARNEEYVSAQFLETEKKTQEADYLSSIHETIPASLDFAAETDQVDEEPNVVEQPATGQDESVHIENDVSIPDQSSAAYVEMPSAPVVSLVDLQPLNSSVVSVAGEGNTFSHVSFCAFCNGENDAQAIVCQTCMAILTLADLEMLIANTHADKLLLRDAVERMESDRLGREFSETELMMLGIGHLNLHNLQYGFDYLRQASELNPNNVVLGSQVNALRIRLEEIKRRDEVHETMPKGKTILVVDDSPTVRKLIAGKLEKCGHEVICAADGVEAVERLDDLIPDLVLLDITMPRMDGYQVCKLIRSTNATQNVPVVMISGKDGFFDKVRGRMAGTTGYITKPFGPETLMKAVETYLSDDSIREQAS